MLEEDQSVLNVTLDAGAPRGGHTPFMSQGFLRVGETQVGQHHLRARRTSTILPNRAEMAACRAEMAALFPGRCGRIMT